MSDRISPSNSRGPIEAPCYRWITLGCGVILVAWLAMPSVWLGASTANDNVLLNFTASWCGPCQQMSPVIARLQRQGCPIRKIDIDQEQALARQYNITSVPTFVLISNGKEVERMKGAADENTLRGLVSKLGAPAVNAMQSVIAATENVIENPLIQLGPPAQALPVAKEKAPPKPDKKPFGWPLAGRRKDRTPQSEPATIRGQDGPEASPLAACLRVRVNSGKTVDYGSATVIESQVGKSIALSCAHLFRDLTPTAEIFVDVFDGQSVAATYPAKLLKADFDADISLLTFSAKQPLRVVRIANQDQSATRGAACQTFGCSHGDSPTRETGEITAINRYQGPENLECSREPAQGRSGGSMLRSDGVLLGVCLAADHKEKRGLYCGLNPIYALCRNAGLKELVPTAAVVTLAETTIDTPSVTTPPTVAPERMETTPVSEQIVLNSAAEARDAFQQSAETEVVCIVRPKGRPDAPSRVIIINEATPKLLNYLIDAIDLPR